MRARERMYLSTKNPSCLLLREKNETKTFERNKKRSKGKENVRKQAIEDDTNKHVPFCCKQTNKIYLFLLFVVHLLIQATKEEKSLIIMAHPNEIFFECFFL